MNAGSGGDHDDRYGQPYVQGPPQGYPPQGYGPPPYGPPGYGPSGYPPPRKSKLPLIIGAIVAVVVLAVAALVITKSGAGDNEIGGETTATASGTDAPAPGDAESPQTSATTPASGEDISYEIAGTIDGPIRVTYTGENGEEVEVQVDSVPWSVSIPKAPLIVSISAVQINRPDRPNPDVTIEIKKGGKVVESCTGGMPCTAIP